MSTRARARVVTVVTATLLIPILLATLPVYAFELIYHRNITLVGLGFLRAAVVRDIIEQHAWMDDLWSGRGAHDAKHFDDCEFNGAAAFIREQYRVARQGLAASRLWTTSTMFGRILHPVQDFYSHSNWVELGFPLTGDPATAARSDLVDLSGAQSSLARHWFAPAGGDVVRGDILLGGDDWVGIPVGWSIDRNGAGRFVPTLVDPQGRTRGRLLVTGKGKGDDDCKVPFKDVPLLVNAYTGIKHTNLNKDCPDCGAPDVPADERRTKHEKARALAILQTAYEWCRLVREAALVGQDGLLLALWVRAGGDPHPPGTPCGPASPGPTPVVVIIDSIQILNAGDGRDEPGEIQFAAVLYDDPLNFHRSVHVTNRRGRMDLRAGDFVPANQLPDPLSLCVPQGRGAVFALHAWDNDDPMDDQYGLDFDNVDDDDEVLVGFQRAFGAELPSGVQVARSADLEVRFRVSRSTGGWPPIDRAFCLPEQESIQ